MLKKNYNLVLMLTVLFVIAVIGFTISPISGWCRDVENRGGDSSISVGGKQSTSPGESPKLDATAFTISSTFYITSARGTEDFSGEFWFENQKTFETTSIINAKTCKGYALPAGTYKVYPCLKGDALMLEGEVYVTLSPNKP